MNKISNTNSKCVGFCKITVQDFKKNQYLTHWNNLKSISTIHHSILGVLWYFFLSERNFADVFKDLVMWRILCFNWVAVIVSLQLHRFTISWLICLWEHLPGTILIMLIDVRTCFHQWHHFQSRRSRSIWKWRNWVEH